ncbi:glycosyltransferase family 2 protein [Candidatus Proelusimicrobium excrementi]|uniref:glycosyltransferase family 2 protein n=1 Tax=Candidatus Proelusimicrobium excrementi TaxID=3416222 RepID=UPI003C9F8CBD|nr:glycosyltransferase family 2 protein [Elusimicrobiaceae bacterium]
MTELSICIPTCNRAEYLPVMLDSIFKQAVFDGVEVVISDNNSYDDTHRIVKEYQERYKNLSYYKNDINVGFDRNVLNCISRAKGKYCWILGDDDALLPGSVGFVLRNIKSGYDFYTCGLNLCDSKLRFLEQWTLTKGLKDGKVVHMGSDAELMRYLRAVVSNGGLFGYIGGCVFNRSLALKVKGGQRVSGLGWIHIYLLWSFKNFNAKFKVLKRPLVNLRTQNDSLVKERSAIYRLTMEFKGLYIIAEELFRNQPKVKNAFLSAVKRYIAPSSIPPLFVLNKNEKRDWPEFCGWLCKYPYSKSFKKRLGSRWRVNPMYFVRRVINLPVLAFVKRPLKKVRAAVIGR